MPTFKEFINEEENNKLLEEIELEYGSIEAFLSEAEGNIINKAVYHAKRIAAEIMSNKLNGLAKDRVQTILHNGYGRSLNSNEDPGQITHLKDEPLFRDREQHFQHLKHLYATDRNAYNKLVTGALKRMPVDVYGSNKKTETMEGQTVSGFGVVESIANKGTAGSVMKFGKDGADKMHSTCVDSKQSCRGEGQQRLGASCLGMCGNYGQLGPRVSNIALENMKTMKAHSNKVEDSYGYNDHNGKPVTASPHLDFATAEYHTILSSLERTKKKSEEAGERKLTIFRQNTANEESAMHYDQMLHHLPEHLKRHLATNNYSAAIAKGSYDPNNPSDRSTHDGVLNNTNFSIKGPEVMFTDKGHAHGLSRSDNLEDASKALSPELDRNGKVVRPAQNAYMVTGGTIDGVRLRQQKSSKKLYGGKLPSFFGKNKPKFFTPYEKLLKLKTARIYGKEITLGADEPANYSHPDGWGHETHYDPHSGKHRTFEYQDYHVYANVARPDENDFYDFNKLNDNVGSDERKPKGSQIKRNRLGQQVGSIHIAAPVASGSNVVADGTVVTDRQGEPTGDKFGLANDPLIFPVQHHIKYDETRIDLNHPLEKFAGEAAEKKRRSQRVAMPEYIPAPETKQEKGELR